MRKFHPPKVGMVQQKWVPAKLWDEIIQKMPIPCVDLIFQLPDNSILYGWRLISPYRNVWALVGGRMLHGENLLQSASRIAKEYGLLFGRIYLNGVFPVNFPHRADVVISLAALAISGEAQVDGYEFSKFIWATKPPKRLGENYRRMVKNWSHAAKSKEFLRLNRLA
jgi:ADP-ribose pyrophosphatase YjhB (NUDIX family)